jgi:hypothetical protein
MVIKMNNLAKPFAELTEWEKDISYTAGRRPFIDCSEINAETKRQLIIELSRKNIPPAICECPYGGILMIDLGSFRTRWVNRYPFQTFLEELKKAELISSAKYILDLCKKHNEVCNDHLAYQVATRPI